MIFASGTRSKRTSPFPFQQRAFMKGGIGNPGRGSIGARRDPDTTRSPGRAGDRPRSTRLASRGLALDGRGLAGLHDLLEAPEVILQLHAGLLAEEPGERDPEGAGGGLVV